MNLSRSCALVLLFGVLAVACKAESPPQATPTQTSGAPLVPMLTELEDLDPDEGVLRGSLRAEALADTSESFEYAYNGLNPGPLIRAKVGDRLTVTLDNGLDAATTIHWHGLKVPFEMDGVPWMRDPVGAGESFEYSFELSQAGTFWYHPHFNTERQVDGGLYGALVVEDPAEPKADAELILVFDTEREFDPGRMPGAEGHAHGHGKLRPVWRVNGQRAPVSWEGRGGQVVRARLLNVSSAGYVDLRWPGIRQIAGDQGLLSALRTPERLVLGPGDRVEVELLLGEEGFAIENWPWSLNGGEALGEPQVLVEVSVDEPAPAPQGLDWPFSGLAPTADSGKLDVLYAFAGSDRTGKWMINGERFPEIIIETAVLGDEVWMELRNLSPTEHPFHIHGLVFEVVSKNGAAPPSRTIEDTINLRIRDRVRLRIEADNPGDWMTHCHILPHAEDGMMTVFRVQEP